MKKRGQVGIVILVSVIAVLVVVGILVYFYFNPSGNSTSSNNRSSELPEVPYSFLAVHFEINPWDGEGADRWQNMINMVELANQYNTPLTIMFWPGSAHYALTSQERIAQVREWQAQGHEIGLHNQGCDDSESTKDNSFLYGPEDNEKYLELAGGQEIKSGTVDSCDWTLSSFRYNPGGRYDGRSALAVKYDLVEGHEVYALNMKAGYADNPPCGGTQTKINLYNSLNENEIYGFVNHGEGDVGNLGGTEELVKWLEFLYEADPEGGKRMTVSDLMESYVLPNNLIISEEEVCSSTNPEIQQCLPLALLPEKPGLPSCRIRLYDTDIFNFGRCLNTGIYCATETSESCDGDFYCPQDCITTNIEDYGYVGSCS